MAEFVLISFLFSFQLIQLIVGDFIIQTDLVTDDTTGDVVAGFGDFNADELVDIFIIKSSGKQVDLLLAVQDKKFERYTLISNYSFEKDDRDHNITGLILADFDGDVQIDLLLVTNSSDGVGMVIYWGKGQNKGNISVDDFPFIFPGSFKDDPVLFDYDANMLPDLLTMSATNGTNVVWNVSGDCRPPSVIKNCRHFNSTAVFGGVSMTVPHSGAFVDMTGDLNADLVLSMEGGYQIRTGPLFSEVNKRYTYPNVSGDHFFGQSSFADFNLDGSMEQIVPVCVDEQCTDNGSQIHVYSNGTWHQILSQLDGWHFLLHGSTFAGFSFPTTLRIGDYDLDGYPDIVTVLASSTSQIQRAFLLHNVPCETVGLKSCISFGRAFVVVQDLLPVPDTEIIHLATFFDTNEDGMLDVLLTAVSNTSLQSHSIFLKNSFEDSCFLKVTVLSGLCFKDCQNGNQPYGDNVPGPTIKYLMTTIRGDLQTTTAGQLSQSAHFALQLPFVVFGLGQTPNFVDTLEVGIPYSTIKRTQFFPQQIIPNSQLIVIPYENDQPSNWKMQLFVTPSRQIKYTGFALLITCGLLAIIIVILQWQEMREDAKEKKQDSQKFHFDAM